MFVAACEVDLRLLDEPHSLKEKRAVVRSLKETLRNKFEVSVAEVGTLDLWQRCVLGIACVTGDKRTAASIIQKIINAIDARHDVEIIKSNIEIY